MHEATQSRFPISGPTSHFKMTRLPGFFVFFSSLTAVPSENQCLSSGAYEWSVLISLKHAVGLSQHWFLLQEWFRESLSKLMECSPTCELHSPHLGCGLELILAVYREAHAHSFVLKHLLQFCSSPHMGNRT